MSEPRDEARALRFMVDELRAEPTPELEWDAVERKLLSRIARNDEPRYAERARQPSAFARVATFAVAAAVLALGIGLSGSTRPGGTERAAASVPVAIESVALAAGQAGARGDRDLGALRVGDAIETGDEPVTFVEEGSVRWTLAPASRATVRARGAHGVGHVIALDRGSVRAEVTPRAASEGLVEAFAVEAGGTRVAVHGTLFTVTLSGNEVIVDVEHGSVAIGPVGHVGVTTGHLLVGPARASFSLDGGRTARRLARDVPPQLAMAAPPGDLDPATDGAGAAHPAPMRRQVPAGAPAAAARAPEASAAQAQPTDAPAPEAAAPVAPAFLTEASVRGQLARCFAEAGSSGSSDLKHAVSSTLSLTVNADGSIKSGKFDPPLKPEYMACAAKLLGGRFESGPRTVTIPIAFGPPIK